MKKIIKRIFLALLLGIAIFGLYLFYLDLQPRQPVPKFIGMLPVKGEEIKIGPEKQKEILLRNSWFLGPLNDLDYNWYLYMEFREEDMTLRLAEHMVNEYSYGPPTWISTLWSAEWEEILKYEVTEEGMDLWRKDGEHFGHFTLYFTEDSLLRGDISELPDVPAAKDLFAYEDIGE